MKDKPSILNNVKYKEVSQTRRAIMKTIGAAGALSVTPSFVASANQNGSVASNMFDGYIYVGTYTAPNYAPGGKVPSTAKGIYVYKMNLKGELEMVQSVESENPSFLTVSKSRQFLYCVNELGSDSNGKPLGRVSAYRINEKDGTLTYINTQPTEGTWPCHCSIDSSGKYLLAANYGSGSFVAYPINKDGSLEPMCDLYQSKANGTGAIGARQSGPHAHMIINNNGGQYTFGVDLGADKVLTLVLDSKNGKFTPGEVPFANVASGAGPRHMDFHPTDKFAYVLNELSSTIDVFSFDINRGSFALLHSISTLPVDTKFTRPKFDPTNPGFVPGGANTTAAIKVHPSGKWLYATNRGMNSVVMYRIDLATGKLFAGEWVETQGEIPRGMNIDPSGNLLIVGNQNSDSIQVFAVDQATGELKKPVYTQNSPVPVDFVFNPA